MHSPANSQTINNNTLLLQIGNTRALIDDLCVDADQSAALIARLQARSHTLHDAITIPANAAPLLLADFVVRYIEHVPDHIEAMYSIAQGAGLGEQVTPVLQVALNYFLHPCDLIASRSTIHALLPAAYIAHRLLEEINDRFMTLCGCPLTPMDTTRANLISHELIGEPFAVELDQAVLFSAELLVAEQNLSGAEFKYFLPRYRAKVGSTKPSRWPCLAASRSIFVNFAPPR